MISSRIKELFKSPAWVLSFYTAVLSIGLPFLIAGAFSLIGILFGISNEVLGDFIAYLCTGIAVAIMCFYICRTHPKSVWYTPIICNVITLWAGLGNYFEGSPFFNETLPFGIGWILSIIASRWGSIIGRSGSSKDKMT